MDCSHVCFWLGPSTKILVGRWAITKGNNVVHRFVRSWAYYALPSPNENTLY
jgi:hypothetical protein